MLKEAFIGIIYRKEMKLNENRREYERTASGKYWKQYDRKR